MKKEVSFTELKDDKVEVQQEKPLQVTEYYDHANEDKCKSIGVWHYKEKQEYRVTLHEDSFLYAMILSDDRHLLVTI